MKKTQVLALTVTATALALGGCKLGSNDKAAPTTNKTAATTTAPATTGTTTASTTTGATTAAATTPTTTGATTATTTTGAATTPATTATQKTSQTTTTNQQYAMNTKAKNSLSADTSNVASAAPSKKPIQLPQPAVYVQKGKMTKPAVSVNSTDGSKVNVKGGNVAVTDSTGSVKVNGTTGAVKVNGSDGSVKVNTTGSN